MRWTQDSFAAPTAFAPAACGSLMLFPKTAGIPPKTHAPCPDHEAADQTTPDSPPYAPPRELFFQKCVGRGEWMRIFAVSHPPSRPRENCDFMEYRFPGRTV